MSAERSFTPTEIATLRELLDQGGLLVDLAVRAHERRSRTGKATGEVKKNDWTPEEAKLHGLQNSLRSALAAHKNSEKALRAAQAEADRTQGDVLRVSEALQVYRASASGEAVDVGLLAPDAE